MSDNKKKNRFNKHGIKCSTCEYYDKKYDYCEEKDIENCTKQNHTDFSKCREYLVRGDLVMF